MKYICIILTAIFFISCQEKNSTDKIDIFSVPEKKIVQKEEIKLDSIIFPTEIYPFGEWIIGINLPNYSPNVFDFINKNTLQKEFSCIKYGNGANELRDCNPHFFQRIGDTIRINANMFMLNTLVFENKNLSLVATENIKANPLNNFIELNPKKFAFKSSLESPIYDIYDVKKEQNIAIFGSYPDVKLTNVQEEADYANFFLRKIYFFLIFFKRVKI